MTTESTQDNKDIMGPIEGGFRGTLTWNQNLSKKLSHEVPELTPVAIHPSVQAERDTFDEKLRNYIEPLDSGRSAEALQVMGPLKRNWAIYEYLAAHPEDIKDVDFGTTNNVEELKSLLRKRDLDAIGDFMIREDKAAREKALGPAVLPPVLYNSPTEIETDSDKAHGVLLPEDSEDDQKHGLQQAAVPLYGASGAPEVDNTPKGIVEEGEDDADVEGGVQIK